MRITQQVIVMSVSKQENSTLDAINSIRFEKFLKDNNFKFNNAEGMYKGVKEESFVILVFNRDQIELLLAVASQYKQESVLHQDSNGKARLIFIEDKSEMLLGDMLEVSSIEGLDAYTKMNNKFYAIA